MDEESVTSIGRALIDAKANIKRCPICFSITDDIPCRICQDTTRNKSIICVVETAKDVIALEKAGNFKGYYHVLEGSLSPGRNIGPDKLRIKELLERLDKGGYEEVILALNSNVEGEATAMYLGRLLKPFSIKATRIAHGLPIGGELEFADEMTLMYAFEDRKEL
jgi:recombination protein RecR